MDEDIGFVIANETGVFFKAYDEAAFVLSELTDYKVIRQKSGVCRLGFPVGSVDHVKALCIKNHVNFRFYNKNQEIAAQESFNDNQFNSLLERFDKHCIINKEVKRQDKRMEANFNENSNNIVKCQNASFIQGQGITMENAVMDVLNQVNEILDSGRKIQTVSLLENTSLKNRGVIQVQGVVVYEI